jgi:lipoprotein-anchoring transpeptidase ErfK/SrfK
MHRHVSPGAHARRYGPAALAATLLGSLSLLLASACGSSPPPDRAARMEINAVQGARDSRPDLGLAVNASGGRLRHVTVADGQGHPVAGYIEPGATAWHSDWSLQPSQSYVVTAAAVNPQGKKTTMTRMFQTFTPAHTFSAQVNADDGADAAGPTYGVAMPIMVTFSQPVTDRAAVERSFQLQTSQPVVGAWHWLDSTHVNFRPKTYWPQYTAVRFTAHLAGTQGAPGTFGSSDLQQDFKIGESIVSSVSASGHYMKVWLNGSSTPTFSWPVSTGSPGDDTPDGQYVTMDKGNPVDMNSASFGVGPGSPGYYNVEVYDSVRFTWSGNYVHSAPWSVGDQGVDNVSHGCVNLAPQYAEWYYDHATYGDPVTVTGSPTPGTSGDGWTDWFLSWPDLVKGSALGQAAVAGPNGSYFTDPTTASATPAPSPTATGRGARTARPSTTPRPSATHSAHSKTALRGQPGPVVREGAPFLAG